MDFYEMSNTWIILVIFILTLLVWVIWAGFLSKGIRSADELLKGGKQQENIRNWRIAFSTAASYVLVAGYVVFYVNYSLLWGFWLLLFPLLNIVTFFVFSCFVLRIRRVVDASAGERGPLISLINQSAPDDASGALASRTFSIFMLVLLVFGMMVEAVYGANVLTRLPGFPLGVIWVIVLIISTSLLTAVLGGFRAVLRTDLIQGGLLVVLLLALAFSLGQADTSANIPADRSFPDGWLLATFTVNTFLIPYVSLNPWHLHSLEEGPRGEGPGSTQSSIFESVLKLPFFWGIIAINLVAVLIIVSIGRSSSAEIGILSIFLIAGEMQTDISIWLSGAVVLFVVLALITTIDSMLLSHFYHVYKAFNTSNVIDRHEPNEQRFELRRVRYYMSLTYLLFFPPVLFLATTQRELFQTILSIGGMVIILAPWVIKLVILRTANISVKSSKLELILFLGLVIGNVAYILSPFYETRGQLYLLLASMLFHFVSGIISVVRLPKPG